MGHAAASPSTRTATSLARNVTLIAQGTPSIERTRGTDFWKQRSTRPCVEAYGYVEGLTATRLAQTGSVPSSAHRPDDLPISTQLAHVFRKRTRRSKETALQSANRPIPSSPGIGSLRVSIGTQRIVVLIVAPPFSLSVLPLDKVALVLT
jgi:hypothetical protein